MYVAIATVVTRSNNYCRHVLITATVIIFTGLISYVPATLANATSVEMGYPFAQVFTVTFYYLNVIVNPLVYFCLHPRAKAAFKNWTAKVREACFKSAKITDTTTNASSARASVQAAAQHTDTHISNVPGVNELQV